MPATEPGDWVWVTLEDGADHGCIGLVLESFGNFSAVAVPPRALKGHPETLRAASEEDFSQALDFCVVKALRTHLKPNENLEGFWLKAPVIHFNLTLSHELAREAWQGS